MFAKLLHKYLRIPYVLHVHEYRKVKKSHATVVLLHGIGNSGEVWDTVIDRLPADMNIISVDLLGFGNSPKPIWANYDAKTQARAVATTLFRLGRVRPMVFVGHSLGALTSVEIAKNYPLLVHSLILCSPPFYVPANPSKRLDIKTDKILRRIYGAVRTHPEQFMRLSAFAKRHNLVSLAFDVDESNVDAYMAALEAMIINQTSFDDALKLAVPTHIIRGNFDPFVVSSNLRKLKRLNSHISIQSIVAGHELRGRFVNSVVAAITDTTQSVKSKV